MNHEEALEIASRIKSAWPNSYMDEQMMIHWADFLRPYSVEEAARALTLLQTTEKKIPPQARFADIIEGEAAHRVKCPECGVGFRTQAVVDEHVANVHFSDRAEAKAKESVDAVEQMWNIQLPRKEWEAALFPFDNVTIAVAIVKYYESGAEQPVIADLIEVIRNTEVLRAGVERDHHEEPEMERISPFDEVDASFEIPPWVRGWAVARYHHKDFRVFSEEKSGYDTAQIANARYRTYVWGEQEPMPSEDAERYIAEGALLSNAEIFALMGTS